MRKASAIENTLIQKYSVRILIRTRKVKSMLYVVHIFPYYMQNTSWIFNVCYILQQNIKPKA